MKFRKKPGTVEAFQYDGDLIDTEGKYYVPEWVAVAHQAGILFYMQGDSPDAAPMELYLNVYGEHWNIRVGDYVICNGDGSLDVCSAQAFERDYEPVQSAGKSAGGSADHEHENGNQEKMLNYIGVKIVKAKPEEKDGKQGYKVLYPEGYVSWSPTDVFEKASRILDCEDFINEDM